MSNDTRSAQEAAWPQPDPSQILDMVQASSQALGEPTPKRAGRPALVSWHQVCLAILLCFLRGWHTQLEVWRLLVSERVGDVAPVRVCDQAIYNRIARSPQHLHRVFEHVSQWLRTRQQGWQDRRVAPWASEVYAVDASLLDRLGRFLPWLRPICNGDKRLLAGQISALLDIRRQQWVQVQIWPDAKANCKEHFFSLIQQVQAGALVLFDRGYLSFPLFDALGERGIWWISRYGNNVSYVVRHICYQGDGVLDAVVWLGARRADQARYPVRLLSFWHAGKQYRYLTNVLDPHRLSLADVVRLYARRWDIELAFRLLKDHLQLHHLWSAKWSVIQVQLWCCLILAQIYHALQVEIAQQAGVEVFDVSVALLVRLTPGWLARGLCPLSHAVRCGRDVGLIRPATRHRIQVPWIDPCWVFPPPEEAVQPRPQAHYAQRHCGKGPRSKKAS